MKPNKSIVGFDFEEPNITLHHTVVEGQGRTIWSPELAQDLATFHNIDAEDELTRMLSEQLTEEINREILENLRNPWEEVQLPPLIGPDIEPMVPLPTGILHDMDFIYPINIGIFYSQLIESKIKRLEFK